MLEGFAAAKVLVEAPRRQGPHARAHRTPRSKASSVGRETHGFFDGYAHMQRLGVNSAKRAWREVVEFLQRRRHERCKVLDSIAHRFQYKNGNW